MGMAASQARFLGLTARKTNVEYEGQQVNQARTALSSQSAGLFNQMLGLNVPVPPNATDFYSMRYTYNTGNTDSEIVGYTGLNSGLYNLTVKETVIKPVSYSSNLAITPLEKDGKKYVNFGGKDYELELVKDSALQKEQGLDSDEFYQYKVTSSDLKTVTTYNLAKADYDKAQKDVAQTMKNYYWKDTPVSTLKELKDVTIGTDPKTGQFTSISYVDENGKSVNQPLAIQQVQDDAGYDKAMNDYNYQKMLYERTIADINTQTEIIQQQDRTLELKLRQLDTEQEALQQEMDAVKKVIDKNIESTFKTFA